MTNEPQTPSVNATELSEGPSSSAEIPGSQVPPSRSRRNFDARKDVLFKALAYGHLDYLEEQDIQIISRDRLKASLAGRRAEEYFLELLEETSDDDLHLGVLSRNLENPIRRLFYSDPEVFEHYLFTHSLPLLTFEQQSLIVVITELPEHLLDLFSGNFWQELVGD